MEPTLGNDISGQDSGPLIETENFSHDLQELRLENESMVAEIESLRASYQTLQSSYTEKEEKVAQINQEKEELFKQKADLLEAIKELSSERDSLRDEFTKLEASSREQEVEGVREKEEIKEELESCKDRLEELLKEKNEKNQYFSQKLGMIKQGLARVVDRLDVEGEEHSNELELNGDLGLEFKGILELLSKVELKLDEFTEKRKKEKRELESSLVSLTEENRDINNLLRIALVEKEAAEKSLNKLKGNNEQKRGAILQIAERSLQKVGFGFIVGTGGNELSPENSAANLAPKSDSSECEEEAVSLASTVERIMKNLRLEITQLRRSLDDSRSESERLQSLTEMQAHKMAEYVMYSKELEDRELILTQKVEELHVKIIETEEEVVRWKEACELEVQAGKYLTEEHEKVVHILQQELEKTRTALHVSKSKVKLKDELVATAIAAQEATERSLQQADSRSAGLLARIEELTRELEEIEKRERANRHRIRHICWPWRVLKFNPANTANSTVRNIRRMLPEMQALLHERLSV
ncbi:unnamed protein product [Coffea canephora]|uniref:Uncharacterized protein n=1 Tax=Coffea canephora TaxID=49390 RepID=A0A068UC51_COFCA|nr:unnamed protein product [Coffea canephora]